MTYQVTVQSRALRDIEGVFRWLANNVAPEFADQWYNELQTAIKSLETFPNRCSMAPEAKAIKRDIRQLLFGKHKEYRILFLVQGDTVSVVHVRHSRRARLTVDDEIP